MQKLYRSAWRFTSLSRLAVFLSRYTLYTNCLIIYDDPWSLVLLILKVSLHSGLAHMADRFTVVAARPKRRRVLSYLLTTIRYILLYLMVTAKSGLRRSLRLGVSGLPTARSF